jgi:hypothetical protein
MNCSCQTFYEEHNIQYKCVNVQLQLSPQFVKPQNPKAFGSVTGKCINLSLGRL